MPGRILFLFALLLGAQSAGAADTLRLYFPTGVSQLQRQSIKTLDSALYYDFFTPDSALEILGYADFVGSAASNQTLSAARAEAVKSYLLQNGFAAARMIQTTAKGELPAGTKEPPNGIATHRRVDIIIGGTTAREALSNRSVAFNPERAMPFSPSQKTLSTNDFEIPEILDQTPVGSSFQLSRLFFPAGQHVMYSSSQVELDGLVEALKTLPKIKVRVEGHVCCIDTNMVRDALDEQTREYQLSGNRARYVAQYLVRSGIAADRISHKGFGKRHALVYYESTPEEAAANRRVEIRILEK